MRSELKALGSFQAFLEDLVRVNLLGGRGEFKVGTKTL